MSQLDDWVSAEFQNLAELINEYDEYLFLEMVPVAEQANLIDKSQVFRIVDDRTKTVVMYADSLSNPQAILAKLWTADNTKNDPFAEMMANNMAAKALALKKRRDEEEHLRDFAAFVVANTKSRWVHDGQVWDDQFNNLGSVRKTIV